MNNNPEFEKAFADLKQIGTRVPSAKKTYGLLKELNANTLDAQSDLLIKELHNINYSSNTNDYFYFYFPLVSYILYYKPQYESDLLKYVIGPNFANGTTETKGMIAMITGAMNYKLSQDENYLTQESRDWVMNELPKLEEQIDREIKVCWKELE
ncbi:hypothetical protein [Cytophaga aurantiaca]|uniref:hypothetical protein n=1 Tax=Cytophaga aurantiaca TaxID=29530 RepID=UPI00035DBFCA|nr:hypothetical protein [Cytophaga aurantiaca]